MWAPMVIQVEITRRSREVDGLDAEARDRLDAFLDSDWVKAVEATDGWRASLVMSSRPRR
jgi:hypothetical protein